MATADTDARAQAAAFRAAHPEIEQVDAFVLDLNGHAVGKRYPIADLEKLLGGDAAITPAMQLSDVRGEAWDVAGLGFSDGDPDQPMHPVPNGLAPTPWAARPRAQCLMWFGAPDGTRSWPEPRAVLERVLTRFEPLGLTPVVAIELEFYIIDTERTPEGAPQPPRSPRGGGRPETGEVFRISALEEVDPMLAAIETACRAQGLPVSTWSKEYGPGQYELNLAHVPNALAAADHAALMRRAVTGVARAQGLDATFMSKPYAPHAGSGLQINLSLMDAQGRNAFDPRLPEGATRLGQAIAGMQALAPASLALFAPSFHAYRRLDPNQFTPVTLDWGENNRSVAFRTPYSGPEGRRIEHRFAGAEANPYLVTAAVLAAAHHGLTEKLEPTPAATGNACAEIDPALPRSIWAALEAFERSDPLKDYLSERYVAAYAAAKRAETDAFFAEILPREYAWHL